MKISIIVPVYKVERYLRRCLDSIINQTYRNLEIILVDDGSPDNCPAICDEYASRDSRIRVIHKRNGGVSAARNAGLEIATGDYVLFIDSDDWVELDMCEYLITNAMKTGAEISCCGFYWEGTRSRITTFGKQDVLLGTNDSCLKAFLEKKYFGFNVWNKLFKRTIVDRFDECLSIAEDAYFVFRAILSCNKAVFGIEPKYHYNVRKGSATRSGFDSRSFGTLDFVDKVVRDVGSLRPKYLAEAISLRFEQYLATLNMMLYYRKNREYPHQYGVIVRCLLNTVKESYRKLPAIKLMAFILFIINRRAYVYLVDKYYDRQLRGT